MPAEPEGKWTAEEYLAYERQSGVRHEFLDGEIIATSGANRAHSRISWNLTVALDPQLEGQNCEGFATDMRVYIPAKKRFVYPDLVVACGDPGLEDAELDMLLDPTLIIEVLSPATEDYDRGRKLFDFRSIPSLEMIVLVAQNWVHVEQLVRQEDGSWVLTETADLGATLDLSPIGCQLALKDVYRRVPGL